MSQGRDFHVHHGRWKRYPPVSGQGTARVIVRLRPSESISAIDLHAIQAQLREIVDFDPELVDSRLSDAPYVTIIVRIDATQGAALDRLKRALRGLPGLLPHLYMAPGKEIALDEADLASLELAARAVPG